MIGRLYKKHRNKAADKQDMMDAINTETGFNPKAIVTARLRKRF